VELGMKMKIVAAVLGVLAGLGALWAGQNRNTELHANAEMNAGLADLLDEAPSKAATGAAPVSKDQLGVYALFAAGALAIAASLIVLKFTRSAAALLLLGSVAPIAIQPGLPMIEASGGIAIAGIVALIAAVWAKPKPAASESAPGV
jgi:hypothetical protein